MKILILCAKGFETMEFSVFVDVLGWAKTDYSYPLEVVTGGLQKVVISSFGVPVVMDKTIDQIIVKDYDALAIPGGFEEFGFYDDAYDERFLEIIRSFNKYNKVIASICVGALPIGKSGILENRNATTYHLKERYRQKQLSEFGVVVLNERLVVDDNVISSYSPETAADVAFKLLEALCGTDQMLSVKQAMGFV